MELYERLLYLHQPAATIAQNFAEYIAIDPDGDAAGRIRPALSSLLAARQQYQAEAEEIEREQQERPTPWDDFGGTSTDVQRDAWIARAQAEAEAELARIKTTIKALDGLFLEVCRALYEHGITITGGQISELKRAGMPKAWARILEKLKRKRPASISEAERLDDAEAAAIYQELTRRGFISGPYGTFSYYLGQVTDTARKAPAEPLKWIGNKSEFAYFARRFSDYTQRGRGIIREKALCLAFGFDDQERRNSIRPYLSDEGSAHAHDKAWKPRTSSKIDAAFAAAELARTSTPTPNE